MTQSAKAQVVIVDGKQHNSGDDFAPERSRWDELGLETRATGCVSESDLITECSNSEILVYLGLDIPFTAHVLNALTQCRLVVRYGIGMDSVDIPAATANGIVVANAAEYCVREVADHAAALILNLARRISVLDRFVHEGNWLGALDITGPVPRLSTQTVGLVGFGRISRQVATNLKPFFGTILAHDPYLTQSQADPYGVQLVPLDELVEQADFVSVHTPLIPETEGLIGAEQFERMKKTAYVVNTSRGPVIDESALIAALTNNQIAGAALDVVATEPLPREHPLRDLDNVILTPHFSYHSIQANEDLRESVIATVADVAQGYWPRHVMNPTVQPRSPLQRRE